MRVLLLWLIVAIYLGGAFGFARLNSSVFESNARPAGLGLLVLFFLPASLIGLLLMACVLTPFWWLYPERHVSLIDLEGTNAEKEAWAEYRAILSRKPLWRRLAEKLKLAPHTGPQWPMLGEDAV